MKNDYNDTDTPKELDCLDKKIIKLLNSMKINARPE